MPDITAFAKISAQAGESSKSGRIPSKEWRIKASPVVASCRNPIRSTLASITSCPPQTAKPLINLGLGDPTHYPLHPSPAEASTAIAEAASGRSNGYVEGVGTVKARQAVADYHKKWDRVEYNAKDIVLTHGVGQALDLIFSVILPPATMQPSNILLPRPGFSQYAMLINTLGAEIRYYDCIEENGWEVDLEMMQGLCDENTRAIMVTNPSNPCGSNFSEQHLRSILDIASQHKVLVVADEIYAHMTWNAPFVPLAALSDEVPVVTLCGLSKRFLLPGWRFGWAMLHDPLGVAGEISEGMALWGNRFFGPSSIAQAALPAILNTSEEWHNEVIEKVKTNAHIIENGIKSIPGLSCTTPQGALYMLVKIDYSAFPQLGDDVGFSTALYRDQAVFVLPGMCFDAPGYVRVVIASPAEIMEEVVERLREFCQTHAKA